MKEYISRAEASAMCGVSGQTISNWARKGLIKSYKTGACRKSPLRYLRADIERVSAYAAKVNESREDLMTLKRDVDGRRMALRRQLSEMNETFNDNVSERLRKTGLLGEFISILKYMHGSDAPFKGMGLRQYPDRYLDILGDYLSMVPARDTAKRYERTPERIRQMRRDIMWEIGQEDLTAAIRSVVEENRALNERVACLTSRILALGYSPDGDSPVIDDPNVRRALGISISDIEGISVRLFNCLHVSGMETVGDVASMPRTEVMKLRNFGVKTMEELELLLGSLGLGFGIDTERYGIRSFYKRVWNQRNI